MPVVGFIRDGSADASARLAAAFRKGLNETGNVEGQNVTVEYHWLEGQYDRLPVLVADLVRRQVAVIATPGGVPALAAKAATATIPIVFGFAENPVKFGLVDSLARPGGNATGINFFLAEVVAKRLQLLHDLVPKAVRIAVLVNLGNASAAESAIRDVQEAAPAIGLQIQIILNATTIGEIDAAFATLARERPDALFVAPDGFLDSRRAQLILARWPFRLSFLRDSAHCSASIASPGRLAFSSIDPPACSSWPRKFPIATIWADAPGAFEGATEHVVANRLPGCAIAFQPVGSACLPCS
jgi:putative ABC transport system substrate-binding protein